MPVLHEQDLTSFFNLEMYKGEQDGVDELNTYSRTPASTVIAKMWHSGGLKTSLPMSMIVFFPEATQSKESIVVFKTSKKWMQYYSIQNSPMNAYLSDISSKGKSLFYTTTISEFYNWSLNPNVPNEVKEVALFFRKNSFHVSSPSDLAKISLGIAIQDLQKLSKTRFDLDELGKIKRNLNISLRTSTDPVRALTKSTNKLLGNFKLKGKIAFKVLAIPNVFNSKIRLIKIAFRILK